MVQTLFLVFASFPFIYWLAFYYVYKISVYHSPLLFFCSLPQYRLHYEKEHVKIEYLSKHIFLNSPITISVRCSDEPAEEDDEAQRGEVTLSKPHSK